MGYCDSAFQQHARSPSDPPARFTLTGSLRSEVVAWSTAHLFSDAPWKTRQLRCKSGNGEKASWPRRTILLIVSGDPRADG